MTTPAHPAQPRHPAHPACPPAPSDRYDVEHALEALPTVARACVARRDPRSTVVLVALDPATTIGDRDLEAELARALADHGENPAAVRVRIVTGWLPSRDAFPARIRRRCVRARYAPLLVTVLTPLAAPLAVASGA